MAADANHPSRRTFVADVGRLATGAALGGMLAGIPDVLEAAVPAAPDAAPGDWDFSWVNRLSGVTNRAVFDWNAMEDPPEATPMDYAARYLDSCAMAYGDREPARAVLVVRAAATPAALTDAAWARYSIGAERKITDPVTRAPAVRNPFWTGGPPSADTPPTMQDLVQRGVIVLVCNMALTHMAHRFATAAGRDPADVLHDLRSLLVPTATAVPSGIFGLVRAQNAGCGLVRV